jgi:uncharacterized protein
MRRQTVVVFLKTPMLGRVKTRLARAIGDIAALRFHRETAARLIRALQHDRRWRVMLALSPRGALRHRDIPGPGLRHIDQGQGDLGRRMARALRLAGGPAVLVGTDIPDLSPAIVAQAFHALRSHDAVLGPAEDGGYWLVGVNDPALARFDGVRWSTRHALADTRAKLKHRRVVLLAPLADIDTPEDYRSWRSRSR